MTIPAFLQDAEEEDLAELARFTGLELNTPMSDAELDALASETCRYLASARADRARYEEAEKSEVLRIRAFYDRRFQPIDRRITELEAIGEEIAKRAQFPGKPKSRKVAFGSYGSRRVPERVEVVDETAALDWLKKGGYTQAVRSKESVDKKLAKPIVSTHIATHEGEVPPGFEHTSETEKFFINAET